MAKKLTKGQIAERKAEKDIQKISRIIPVLQWYDRDAADYALGLDGDEDTGLTDKQFKFLVSKLPDYFDYTGLTEMFIEAVRSVVEDNPETFPNLQD